MDLEIAEERMTGLLKASVSVIRESNTFADCSRWTRRDLLGGGDRPEVIEISRDIRVWIVQSDTFPFLCMSILLVAHHRTFTMGVEKAEFWGQIRLLIVSLGRSGSFLLERS